MPPWLAGEEPLGPGELERAALIGALLHGFGVAPGVGFRRLHDPARLVIPGVCCRLTVSRSLTTLRGFLQG